MEAKNLRIGNWVCENALVESEAWHQQVIGIGIKDEDDILVANGDIYKAKELHPIPLDENWLKKYSFEHFDNGAFALEGSIYTVEYIRNHWHLLYRSNHVIAQPFKYVHELQNLFFALTGTELEMKIERSTCGTTGWG